MEEAKSYPSNIPQLVGMAKQGDRGAATLLEILLSNQPDDERSAWLLRKVEVSEILGALELLRNSDDERIWNIAEALTSIKKAQGEAKQPPEEVANQIKAEMNEVCGNLSKVMTKVRSILFEMSRY